MSYTGFDPTIPQRVEYSGTQLDATTRLRVSNPVVVFDSKQIRGIAETLFWSTEVFGGGTITQSPTRSSSLMAVATGGDGALRQAKGRVIYQPGRPMLHYLSFVTPEEDANVMWRCGYYDENDGVFLQGQGSDYSIVLRSSTSGSPVDIAIPRASWTDPLDGTGTSGVTLDLNQRNCLLWIDLQWLSIGQVRVGVVRDGVPYIAATFDHSNASGGAYMANPNLVHRAEIMAVSTPSVASPTLEVICSSAISESGYTPLGLVTSVSTERTGVTVDANYTELAALRVSSALTSRQSFQVTDLSLMCSTGGNVHWVLVLNPTGVSAGTWLSAGAGSGLEQNTTRGQGWTRGNEDHVLAEGYFSNNSDVAVVSFANGRITPGADCAGVADVISLMAANASGGATETVFGACVVQELF